MYFFSLCVQIWCMSFTCSTSRSTPAPFQMLSSHMWLVAPLLQSMIVFVCYAESEVRNYKTRINWHCLFFPIPMIYFIASSSQHSLPSCCFCQQSGNLPSMCCQGSQGSQDRLPEIKSHVHLFLDVWPNRGMSWNLLTSLPLSYEAAQFFWSSTGFSALLIFFQNKWIDTYKMLLLIELLANDVY